MISTVCVISSRKIFSAQSSLLVCREAAKILVSKAFQFIWILVPGIKNEAFQAQ